MVTITTKYIPETGLAAQLKVLFTVRLDTGDGRELSVGTLIGEPQWGLMITRLLSTREYLMGFKDKSDQDVMWWLLNVFSCFCWKPFRKASWEHFMTSWGVGVANCCYVLNFSSANFEKLDSFFKCFFFFWRKNSCLSFSGGIPCLSCVLNLGFRSKLSDGEQTIFISFQRTSSAL